MNYIILSIDGLTQKDTDVLIISIIGELSTIVYKNIHLNYAFINRMNKL